MKKMMIGLTLFLALTIGCKKEAGDLVPGTTVESTTINATMNDELQVFTTKCLSAKYALLVNTTADVKSLDGFYVASKDASTEASLITDQREGLAKSNFAYTDFKVVVSIFDIKQLGKQISYNATEHYTLTSNQPDPDRPSTFIQPEGFYQHSYTVVRTGTSFKLVNETCNDQPWAFNANPTMVKIPADSFANTEESAKYAYNATAAVNFAYAHWSSVPGSPYYDFTNLGGDCTNFLNWSLLSAGWVMNSNWHYYSLSNRSACWTGANNFKTYVLSSGRIYSACYVPSSLSVGDILQADWYPANGVVDHSMLVTKKVGSLIYLTYRSNNTKDKPMNQLPSNASYYGWHVKASANKMYN